MSDFFRGWFGSALFIAIFPNVQRYPHPRRTHKALRSRIKHNRTCSRPRRNHRV